jgi:hypothetical protein
MSTSNDLDLSQERRWNRSSWLALSFALFLFTYTSFQIWLNLQVAGDGWAWLGDIRSAVPEISFTTQVLGSESPLLADDKLISIEGESMANLVARLFVWQQPPPPNWPDGTVLTYLVEREGEIITLAVPVFRYGFGERLVATLRFQGLPAVVQLVGSLFFFSVGVIVFLLRPRERAAQALLILGTAFLFNSAPTSQFATGFFYPNRPPSVPSTPGSWGLTPA